MSEHKCEGKIWGHTKYLPCSKTARYEHEGRWYCKRHHPPTVQEKLDARHKKWEEDSKSRLQAVKEANEARAEMQRKAAAYDGLIAQRDALLAEHQQTLDLQQRSYEREIRLEVEAEREECAKLCEEYDDDRGTGETWGPRFAAIIRARNP